MTLLHVNSATMATTMISRDELRQRAEQFRASGSLGKPGALSRLFDFLLERSLAGDVPKEIEIALEVFGKSTTFDVAQDSVVRVYVHKLRRRLEEFAARSLSPQDSRLTIPKGEYRLVLDSPVVVSAPTEAPPPLVQKRWATRLGWPLGVAAAFIAGVLLTFAFTRDPQARELNAVRHSAIWGPLLDDDLPITLVIGDYFLLGEVDDTDNVRRLVREFFVNSDQDFLDQLQLNPELMRPYRNIELTYLPAATAFALHDLMPVLNAGKPVRVALVSALDPNVLKSTHVVYVGYISGMGMLADRVFADSRLAIGGSFDELHDQKTGETYLSTAMPNGADGGSFRDFGYFSTFAGPNGNRVVIVSGTRDNGVMQVAEAVSRRSSVAEIDAKIGDAESFESLYQVDGLARAGLNARLLFVSSRKDDAIWLGAP